MAHVEDRWTVPDPDTGKRVRSPRWGTGKRWLAVWQEPDGRRRKKAFDRKEVAVAHIQHAEVDKRTGAYVSAERGAITIRSWAAMWLPAQTHLKDSGRERVDGILENHVLPRWGDTALADVRREDVQSWVLTIPGAPGTVRRVHGVLLKMLAEAVEARRVPRNEAAKVNLPSSTAREHRYLSVTELDRLLSAAGPWAPLFRCLALTGMRLGEASELRVRDVNLHRRRATLSRSTTTLTGRVVTGTTKNAETRTVPLPEEVIADMRAAVKARPGRDDLLYVAPRGGQLRKDNVRRAFNAARERAGLEAGLRPHDLRHTAASLAVASGASVKTLQRMLGHASAAITLDVYAGLFDQELDDVMDRMTRHIAAERARPQPPQSPHGEAA